VEAVEFSRFRFHRKRTASSFRFHIPAGDNAKHQQLENLHVVMTKEHLLAFADANRHSENQHTKSTLLLCMRKPYSLGTPSLCQHNQR